MSAPADPASSKNSSRRRAAVALVIVAQWLGTSLWFSPSGAADGLMARLAIGPAAFGWLVAATQLGFIAGTLVFASSGAADRYAASRVFAASCVCGAAANAMLAAPEVGYDAAWGLRFIVGVSLAGIYPLGMKMIVQWAGGRPAAALGWLVGMLTLGTAMPHALRASGASWPWQAVVLSSSLLALLGGGVIAVLGDGPHGASPTRAGAASPLAATGLSALREVFASRAFRASAFGYFGHMWELYAFWSVLPWLAAPICAELGRGGEAAPSVALFSFAVIAIGAVGCIGGGLWSRRIGSARVAALALAGSGAMCLVYPLISGQAIGWRIAALLFWGLCVIADSPQFSALSARHAPPGRLGSALLAQNGVGFLITVVSILLLSRALPAWGPEALWLLLPGPVLGLLALRPLLAGQSSEIEVSSGVSAVVRRDTDGAGSASRSSLPNVPK